MGGGDQAFLAGLNAKMAFLAEPAVDDDMSFQFSSKLADEPDGDPPSFPQSRAFRHGLKNWLSRKNIRKSLEYRTAS